RTYLAFRPRVSSFSFGTLFFLTLPATSGISSLSLHDALPISRLLPYDGPVYYERSVLRKVARIKVPVYVFTGWEDMYSRGDMRLIDSLRTPSLLVIDPSTHHGTGEIGEVGAPYGGSPSNQLSSGALNSSPPPGEDIAWLNRWVK